jgi:hypothetical protein
MCRVIGCVVGINFILHPSSTNLMAIRVVESKAKSAWKGAIGNYRACGAQGE